MKPANSPFANEISQYSSDRILDIIKNSKDYAPQLVYGCRVEADVRELDLDREEVSRHSSSIEIADFPDRRLIEIIQNFNDYLPQVVYESRAVADLRDLKIDEVTISHNLNENDVKNYSDKKLIDMINRSTEYSPKLIIACRSEVERRKLKMDKVRVAGSFRRDEIMEVQQRLKIDTSVIDIRRNLQNRGFSEEDALKLIDIAINSNDIHVVEERESDKSGIGVFGILFLIYFVVKWIIVLSR